MQSEDTTQYETDCTHELLVQNSNPTQQTVRKCYHIQLRSTDKQIQSQMSTKTEAFNENQESLEFYQIKLMEKDREISSFQAKMKKNEFKTQRDMTELKMAEEKARNALKETKMKLDKMTLTATEASEQNKILQHRMKQLKQEKDKQVDNIKNQYNKLKLEVRSYERILPTHTFMTQLGANYSQMPTYQEIFMNWKERVEKVELLEQQLKKLQDQISQKIRQHIQSEQDMKNKQNQAEKIHREAITKMLTVQSEISTMRLHVEQSDTKYQQLWAQFRQAQQTIIGLIDDKKSLETTLEECRQTCISEFKLKDEQISRFVRAHEKQIDEIRANYEQKQDQHEHKLALFEQQQRVYHQRYEREKQRFQLASQQYEQYCTKIKQEILQEKHQNKKLREQIIQLTASNNQLIQTNREKILKLTELQILMQSMKKQVKQSHNSAKGLKTQTDGIQEQYSSNLESLESMLIELKNENEEMKDELACKEKQTIILCNQLEEYKNRIGPNRNSFPKVELETEIRRRNESLVAIENSDPHSPEILPTNTNSYNLSQNNLINEIADSLDSKSVSSKSRRNTIAISKNISEQELSNQLLQQNQQQNTKFNTQLAIKIKQISELKQHELINLRKQLKDQQSAHENDLFELKIKTKKHQEYLQSQKQQFEQQLKKIKVEYQIMKQNKKKHMQNMENIKDQLKKKQQLHKLVQNDNKQLQSTKKSLELINKSLQQQIESLKKNHEEIQIKQHHKTKQKQDQYEETINRLTNKYKVEIDKLNEERQKYCSEIEQLRKSKGVFQMQIDTLKMQITSLDSIIISKNKEITMLNDLLGNERKERTLRTVQSLASLDDIEMQDQQNFKQFYNKLPQKQAQIALLQRQVQQYKQQISDLIETHDRKLKNMEKQMDQYIQEIIKMKLVIAESQLKILEKTHLYNKLRDKLVKNG